MLILKDLQKESGFFSSERGCIFLLLLHCNALVQNTVLIDRQNLFLRWHEDLISNTAFFIDSGSLLKRYKIRKNLEASLMSAESR